MEAVLAFSRASKGIHMRSWSTVGKRVSGFGQDAKRPAFFFRLR